MTALVNFFSNDQSNDWRNDEQDHNNVETEKDEFVEQREQSPFVNADNAGQWSQTVMNSDDEFGPGDEEAEDDDLLEDDSDLIEDDEDLPLEPEEEEGEELVGVDLEEDGEDEDFDDTDTSINQSTSFDADFRPNDHGRTTGAGPIDSQPGTI